MRIVDEFKVWMEKHLEEPFLQKEIYSAEIMSESNADRKILQAG